jgi:uncharacterized protein YjeT (DUF2065 family)
MKTNILNQFTVSFMFAAVTANSLFLFANGLFMLVAPMTWYLWVPGVTTTGMYNQHFIRDIGIIQMFLGVVFALGWFRPALRFTAWAAATSWLIAHALFHVWEVAAGICAPPALVRDFPAVSLPALLGIVLTVWAWKTSRPFSKS